MRHSRGLALAVTLLVVALAVAVQGYFGLPYQLRFSRTALNYWVAAGISLALPVLVFWVTNFWKEKWIRRLCIGLASVLAVPCLLFSGLSMLEAPEYDAKVDGSYELLSESGQGVVTFRLYRTNCGATCAFGLDLREERDLFMGLKLVSPLWSLDRTSEGAVVADESTVRVVAGSNTLWVKSR